MVVILLTADNFWTQYGSKWAQVIQKCALGYTHLQQPICFKQPPFTPFFLEVKFYIIFLTIKNTHHIITFTFPQGRWTKHRNFCQIFFSTTQTCKPCWVPRRKNKNSVWRSVDPLWFRMTCVCMWEGNHSYFTHWDRWDFSYHSQWRQLDPLII